MPQRHRVSAQLAAPRSGNFRRAPSQVTASKLASYIYHLRSYADESTTISGGNLFKHYIVRNRRHHPLYRHQPHMKTAEAKRAIKSRTIIVYRVLATIDAFPLAAG